MLPDHIPSLVGFELVGASDEKTYGRCLSLGAYSGWVDVIGNCIFLMKGSADPSFDKLIICAILFLPFYGIGWLIRYIFSGRTDLWINPTR